MTSKLLLAVGAATASVGLPWLCGKRAACKQVSQEETAFQEKPNSSLYI
jgi:hypothetical protein